MTEPQKKEIKDVKDSTYAIFTALLDFEPMLAKMLKQLEALLYDLNENMDSLAGLLDEES